MKQIREIRVKDLIFYFYLQLCFIIAIWAFFAVSVSLKIFKIETAYLVLIAIALCYMPLRLLIIGSVLMYKAYAPMEVRKKCRFEPTCSTYMIIAVKKYGIIIGVAKGIKRLCRCKPPNGGIDYP